MPAPGSLLPPSSDTYAAEQRGLLMADDGYGGADWWVRRLDGHGDVEIVDQDLPNPLVDGITATTDTDAPPLIVLGLQCRTGSAATAELARVDLRAAFRRSTTNEQLHLMIPGEGHGYYIGRARGVKVTRVFPAGGVFTAIAQFLATDPVFHLVAP